MCYVCVGSPLWNGKLTPWFSSIFSMSAGAVNYPSTLLSVYQTAQNIAGVHLLNETSPSCQCVPDHVREELLRQRAQREPSRAGKMYWMNACKKVGIVEEDGALWLRPGEEAKETTAAEEEEGTAASTAEASSSNSAQKKKRKMSSQDGDSQGTSSDVARSRASSDASKSGDNNDNDETELGASKESDGNSKDGKDSPTL